MACALLVNTGQPAPAFGATPVPNAGPLDADHHASVDAAVYPWSSVGKLFNSTGGACTAVAVAVDRVLTAAHCLYVFRTHRFLPPDAVHFLLGYARGDYRVHATVARYAIGPGYDPDDERGTAADDWAVLFLSRPLPADVRPLALTDHPPAPNTAISVGGFAQDRAFVMTADTACRTTGFTGGGLIVHDCVTQHGDSGAPLLLRGEDGAYRCFALTVGISRVNGKTVGVAAPVDPGRLAAARPRP